MKLRIPKALLAAMFISCGVTLPAQDAPKNIFELYKITSGGCVMQELADIGRPLTGSGGGNPPDWPEPKVTASENIDDLLKPYREYLRQHPFVPTTVQKLNNGNELFLEGNLWGLRTSSGKVLHPPQFQYMEPVGSNLRAFHNGACQYLDGLTGKPLLPDSYVFIKEIGKDQFLVRTKDGYGIVKDGKTVVESKYRRIEIEKTGNRAYYVIDNTFALLDDFKTRVLPGMGITYLNDRYISTSENIIDVTARRKLICEEKQFYFVLLSKEPAVFSIKRSNENYSFLIDIEGNLLTAQAFSNISAYYEGGLAIAAVSKQNADKVTNLHGLINLKGEWVLPPEYKWISNQNRYWLAQTPQGQELLFHLDGQPVVTEKSPLNKYYSIKPVSSDFAICTAQSGDKTVKEIVRISTGKVIRKDVPYESIKIVNSDKQKCQQQRYIAISKEGEQILDEDFKPITPVMKRYYYAGNNFEGLHFQSTGKGYTLFNCKGKALVFNINGQKEESFKGITIVDDNIVYACLNNGTPYWLFDKGKNKVLEKEIGNIDPFGIQGLYRVASTHPEHKGVVNSEGETIIPVQFKTFTTIDRHTGNTIFETFGGKAGLLDSRGNLVNNQLYKEVRRLVFNLYLVNSNGKYGVINHLGEEILPVQYQKIHWSDGIFTAKSDSQELQFNITGSRLK